MKRIHFILLKVLKYGTLLSTLGLIISVCVQIFARFFLENTPAWTEEAARMFFIYAISFAAGLALKNRYYVYWDLVYNKLSPTWKNRMDLLIPTLTCLLFGIMALFSLQFVKMGMVETSPSMKISMAIPFFSAFILSATLSYFAGIDIRKALKHYRS